MGSQIAPSELSAFEDTILKTFELHRLMRAGKCESVEAESLRDAMDGPWRELTESEQQTTRLVSAELFNLERESLNREAAVEAELASSRAASRFYRGILMEIGKAIGDAAFTDDTGGRHAEVLAMKLPTLVRRLVDERAGKHEEGAAGHEADG